MKASHKVRDQLTIGIPINEVPQFKQYVMGSIQTTEKICAAAKIKPNQLPLPSRKAYKYLKSVDLKHLPIVQHSTVQSQKRVSIRQIRSQHQQIQQQIAQVAHHSGVDSTSGQHLLQQIRQTIQDIEEGCDLKGATPANLTGQSRQIYCWLKFLLSEDNLPAHITTLQQFHHLVQLTVAQKKSSLSGKIKQPINIHTLTIELANMSPLYRCQLGKAPGVIKINQGFMGAEDAVLQALIDSIVLGKSPQTTSIFYEYSVSEEFAELLLAMELMVEDLTDTAQGSIHNLDQVFEAVNQTYFKNTMSKPKLSWSRTYSQRKFGHYEPSRDRVVMGLNLDAKRVPRYVVEFVMYHELLHKLHGHRLQNGRWLVHTPEFRVDERKFKQYSQAEQHLRDLARTS